MCKVFSSIMGERFNAAGIEVESADLEVLELLPKEKQEFVLGWNVQELQSVNMFWRELQDSKVLDFDSYVIKTNDDAPCLVLAINQFLTLTADGELKLYINYKDGWLDECIYTYPCKLGKRFCRGFLQDRVVICRAVETVIRVAKQGDIKFDSFMIHPSYSGYRKFLLACYEYVGVDISDKEYDWVYPILPQRNIDSEILSIGSFYIGSGKPIKRMARVTLYRDRRINISCNGCTRDVNIFDAGQFGGEGLAILITHALEKMNIVYDGDELNRYTMRVKYPVMACSGRDKIVSTFNGLIDIMNDIGNCNWRIGYEWQKEALLQEGTL